MSVYVEEMEARSLSDALTLLVTAGWGNMPYFGRQEKGNTYRTARAELAVIAMHVLGTIEKLLTDSIHEGRGRSFIPFLSNWACVALKSLRAATFRIRQSKGSTEAKLSMDIAFME